MVPRTVVPVRVVGLKPSTHSPHGFPPRVVHTHLERARLAVRVLDPPSFTNSSARAGLGSAPARPHRRPAELTHETGYDALLARQRPADGRRLVNSTLR